jgi:hydrocephalus-inducing protein
VKKLFSLGIDTTIPAQGSIKVNILFKPTARTLNFVAHVCFVTNRQIVRELSCLTGKCDGLDVVLQEKTIDFGALVLHGTLRQNIFMKNLGEIGAFYSWKTTLTAPHFTITPSKGYVPAKGEVVVEVTFSPKILDSDIRICDIECDMPGNRTPLQLTLVGSCVPLPSAKETVVFDCPVRQSEAKTLAITNPTPTVWHLKPVVTNDRWTVAPLVTIKPNATENFEVVFRSLDGGTHQASLSVVLPTGQAVVFNLVGKTQSPKSNGKFFREIPCRTEHRETMTLYNWLPQTQVFKVLYDYIKPDKPDASIELSGKNVVHIPPLAQLDYQFLFKALREKEVNSVFVYRVVFRNEDTSEYQYYDLQYRLTKGPSFQSKTIISQVRTLRRESVKILNPLQTAVSMTCTLQGATSELTLEPTTMMSVAGKKEAEIFLDYFPLKPGFSQVVYYVGLHD